VPLQGHWQRQQASLRGATRRERRVLALVAAALVVVCAAVAWIALASDARTPAGCVNLTAASTTGGARLHACGAEAARWCRTDAGGRDRVAAALVAACRRAGYRP
jgi:hypothetical protein